MFCWHNKRILLHKYQQKSFFDLTKLYSQCREKFVFFRKIRLNQTNKYKNVRFVKVMVESINMIWYI